MVPRLPLEIEYFILDVLGDDELTFDAVRLKRVCSLVCRAWAAKCQPSIFRSIEIRMADSPSLYHYRRCLDRSPRICPLIQEVRLYETWMEPPVYDLFRAMILPRLPAVHTLWINGEMDNPLRASHRYFRSQFPTITTLELVEVHLKSIHELYRHLSLFPNLSKLTLVNIGWRTSAVPRCPEKKWQQNANLTTPLPLLSHFCWGLESVEVARSPSGLRASENYLEVIKTLLNVMGRTILHLDVNLGICHCLTAPNLGEPSCSS
ncbi:hypothetical protein OH77DRAFT_1426810 [Trametes cingulata]|nr:hypothetical protein OH77DRAFT_1426810 [Trametes cingulata]